MIITDEIQKTLVANGATEEEATKLISELSFIVFAELLKNLPEMEQAEQNEIEGLIKSGTLDKALEKIRTLYSEEDWEALMQSKISPIVDDYWQKVVAPREA